jgi:hypothetical protein
MDLEAAIIRAEMSQTRAALDTKLSMLEDRLHELRPKQYWHRHKPDYLVDRTIGGVLTLTGLAMAVAGIRKRARRRQEAIDAAAMNRMYGSTFVPDAYSHHRRRMEF